MLAARSLGIRTITTMDYEYQPANHVAFRAAHRVVLPEVFPSPIARRQGASARKTRRYQGLKEEIYLGDFEPNDEILQELGIAERDGRALVVARTPPSGAAYHQFGNPQFERLIGQLQAREDCICVVLPRSAAQRQALRTRRSDKLLAPGQAVDSRSLIYGADLFLGAGGTMTREAALLRIPTVSVYAGRRPAADLELARRGLLRILEPGEPLVGVAARAEAPRDLDGLRKRASEVTESFLDGGARLTRSRPCARLAPVSGLRPSQTSPGSACRRQRDHRRGRRDRRQRRPSRRHQDRLRLLDRRWRGGRKGTPSRAAVVSATGAIGPDPRRR